MRTFFLLLFLIVYQKGNSQKIESLISSYFQEVNETAQTHENLWNYDLYGPILMVNRETREVYSNLPDSLGLFRKTGTIYTGMLPETVNISNTALKWAGRYWSMIMLPLSDNKEERLNLIIHELFQRAQPDLNLRPNNYDNNHLDKKEGRLYLRLELEALKMAIESKNDEEVKRHLKNALSFRRFRYVIYPQADTLENLLELNEGLCEFTGAMMSGRDAQLMRDHFSRRLATFISGESYIRSFAYETVPIYGYLLSERNSNWNKTITINTSLHLLFEEGFQIKIDSKELSKDIENLKKIYDGENIEREEMDRESRIVASKNHYRDLFINQPHVELYFERMNISFDYSNILPLDDTGVVYQTIRVTDNWGILTVTKGALLSTDWSKITVSKPIIIQKGNISGDGWTLKLNEGFSLEESNSIYVLKKK